MKKQKPLEILQPGETNDFWESILRQRDAHDSRWLKTYSRGFKFTAEQYERNRDLIVSDKMAA